MVDAQVQKMARMHRHAKRAPAPEPVFNNLKPRFSPTAVFTSDPAPDPSTTTPAAQPTTTTSTSQTSVQPVTTSKPLVTSTTPQTTTTSQAAQPQTTTTSTSALPTTTSTTPTVTSTSTSTSSAHLTTSSTTTSPTIVVKTTSSTPAEHQTTFVTTTFRSVAPVDSATSTLASASATASSAPSGGVSTAGIIGIAAASVVGVSILAGVGMYFLRRWSKRKDEEYNPDDFRRQSVVLQDEEPSSLYRGNSGGGGSYGSRGPRPPTMIERHYMNLSTPQPPSMAYQPPQQYGVPLTYNDHASPASVPSFVPGEIVSPASPGPRSPPPHGPQYANVPASFYNPMGQSPIASPVSVAPYGSAYDDQGKLIRSPSNGAVALTRGNSVIQSPPQHAGLEPLPLPENDYMDATRASVTPYQAEQYVAISRQLNIPPPVSLPQVSEEHEQGENSYMPVPATDAKQAIDSPFADPQESTAHNQPSRPSSEFHEHNSHVVSDEPVPRVPSIAPMLPDIQLTQRAFSPLSLPASPSPMRATFGIDAKAAPAARADMPPLSPVVSSPRRAQFVQNETRAHDGRETPVEIGFVESPAATPAPQAARQQTAAPASASAEKKRPETLYDDEDAYGGF